MRLAVFIASLSALHVVAEELPDPFGKGGEFELPGMTFPLRPMYLHQGYARSFRVFDPIPSVNPVAIVGTDPLSLSWLESNEDYLIEIQARVFVVSASSVEAYDSLINTFPQLPFVPMPSDESLAEVLQLEVFPVLYDTKAGRVRQ